VAGSTAGMSAVLANHPLDVIKVRLQVQDGRSSTLPAYRGFVDAFTKIGRVEGLRGLYAGLTPNLMGSTIGWGLYFFTYNQAKRRYQDYYDTPQLSAPFHLLSGIEAGIVGTALTNPIWVVKTRLALQKGGGSASAAACPTRYTGTWNALWRIAREEGAAGLYKGFGPSLLLVSHGAIQFMTYEEVKRALAAARVLPPLPPSSRPSGALVTSETSPLPPSSLSVTPAQAPKLAPLDHAFAASVSKIFASTLTYPSQVLRSRQQQYLDAASKTQYRTIASTIDWIVRNEGISGFYKGLLPNTLKVLPASIITFVVYEAINNGLKAV